MGLIKESFFLQATDADVLSAPSRLAAIPASGLLSIEATTILSDGINLGRLTLQLPDGDVPFEDFTIPANGFNITQSVMHSDTQLVFQFQVGQGGHVLLAYEEIGGTETLIYVTLAF